MFNVIDKLNKYVSLVVNNVINSVVNINSLLVFINVILLNILGSIYLFIVKSKI